MPTRRFLSRLYGACLLYDGTFYLVLTVVPLKAVALGASALQLGIVPILGSGVYILAALVFGRLSDRASRHWMARIGATLRTGATLGLIGADSIPAILAWMPLLGIANGLYWPGLQAALGEVSSEGSLGRTLGGFNVSWSTGKMLGFLTGGVLVDRIGYGGPLVLAAALTAATIFVLPGDHASSPRRAPAGRAGEIGSPGAPSLPGKVAPERRRTWRGIGWMSNFVLFGIGATLNFQYPKYLNHLGLGGSDFGVFLALVYLAQTASFLLFMNWGGWHYRIRPLLLAQGAALCAVVSLAWIRHRLLIWAVAPGIGLGLGLSYSSSIYYSLYREAGKGRSTGIHEALLGTGSFVLPFLAGLAVRATGALLAPYLFVGCVLAGVMAVEIAFAARWARPSVS